MWLWRYDTGWLAVLSCCWCGVVIAEMMLLLIAITITSLGDLILQTRVLALLGQVKLFAVSLFFDTVMMSLLSFPFSHLL